MPRRFMQLFPYLSIFVVSLALLIDEIMLTSIYHVLLGEGNTIAAIAIALVGLSASGVAAYLLPVFRDEERLAAAQPALMLAFAVAQVVAVFVIMNIPVTHGDFTFHRGDVTVRLARLAVYNVSVIPFFLGGLAINSILRAHYRSISRLYFADLAGAAFGCLFAPSLLAGFGAPRAIAWIALVPLALGAVGTGKARASWRLRLALVAVPLLLIGADGLRPQVLRFVKMNTMGEVEKPAYRSFAIDSDGLTFERWALDAWTVLRSEDIPQQWENFRGWGLSDRYRGPIPPIVQINFNARFSTYVTGFDGNFESIADWLDADLISIHYLLGRSYDEVLNIGAGGGREVLNALHHGATRVVAVDVNEVAVEDLMKGRLREFSGDLYFDPRVTALADEGRSFAERTQDRFDLVDFSIVGGMNLEKMELLRVDDLFTREALDTYFARLQDDGVFSYVMYSTRADLLEPIAAEAFVTNQPYVPAIKTLAGVRQVAETIGWGREDFAAHVLVAALPGRVSPNYDLIHIIASKRPFRDSERRAFLAVCRRLGFLAYHPTDPDAPVSNLYARLIAAPDLDAFSVSLPFSVYPATDNRPFHYAFDARHLGEALSQGRLASMLADNPLISMGLNIGLLALAVSFGPLIWNFRREPEAFSQLRSGAPLLAFFACLGFGYMAIEIAVLLKLGVYLGKPIYGLAVGLFAFLFSSALGSAFTGRIAPDRLHRSIYISVAALIALGAVFAIFSADWFAASNHLAIQVRIAIAVVSVFPLAFLMGTFFPSGIVLISKDRESMIPLAWAINGCFSVLGIFGTRIVALFAGFDIAIGIGWMAYLLAALCAFLHARSNAAARG